MTYTLIGRSAPACASCDKAKQLLKENNIQFDFIDLSGRHTATRLFNAMGYSTVPLIIDDKGRVIGGYTELSAKLEVVNTSDIGGI